MNRLMGCCAVLALTPAMAAAAETTLRSFDGSVVLEGELLEADDEKYIIRTDRGDLFVQREFVVCEGACPDDATEQNETESRIVALIGFDGVTRIDGELVDVTETDFVVETEAGQLSVCRQFVRCEGDACPAVLIDSEQFAISIPDDGARDFMLNIVDDYVQSKDFNLTRQSGAEDILASLLVGDGRGQQIAQIDVAQMDNVEAIQALFSGGSKFAITRSRITPEELSEAISSNVDSISPYLSERVIGLDAIAFIVNEENGIDVIGQDVASQVLNGEITNWSQLGGADAAVNLHVVSTNAGLESTLAERDLIASVGITPRAIRHDTIEDMNAAIADDRSSFGVVYRSQVEDAKALSLSSTCNIFVGNTDYAIQTEEYPLTIRWHQYAPLSGVESDFARNISEYIATDFGQQSIADSGLVTQELRVLSMQDQGARLLSTILTTPQSVRATNVMRDYTAEVANARRISTSLRFLSGRSDLDNKAEEDISRISDLLRSQEYEGYEVLVFGFSDAFGAFDTNVSLSERRADAVKAILLQENRGYLETDDVRAFGVGPIAPVGCNDEENGRQQNRRVEIWVRPKA